MASTVGGSDSESEKTRFGSPTSDTTDLELAVQNEHDRHVEAVERGKHMVNRMLRRDGGGSLLEPATPTLVRPGTASSSALGEVGSPGAVSGTVGHPVADVAMPGPVVASASMGPETPMVTATPGPEAVDEPETPVLHVVTPGATPAVAVSTPGPTAEAENPASGSRRRSASEELRRVKMAKRKRESKRKKKKRVEAAKAKAARRQATVPDAPTPTAS